MDTSEREIFNFLKAWGGDYTAAAEIARRAGSKRTFHEDPNWAKPVLMRMEERGILQSDAMGRFRIKPLPRKDKNKRWVSPDIAKILQESGVEVEGATTGDDVAPDDYYDQL